MSRFPKHFSAIIHQDSSHPSATDYEAWSNSSQGRSSQRRCDGCGRFICTESFRVMGCAPSCAKPLSVGSKPPVGNSQYRDVADVSVDLLKGYIVEELDTPGEYSNQSSLRLVAVNNEGNVAWDPHWLD